MPRLLYLTVVLVSIICCSLLSSATPEGTKLVQLGKGQLEETLALSKSRDIREAGNRKKMENRQNEDSDKRQKKGRNGSKRKYSRRAKDSKKSNKRQTGQRRKKSPKRRRQRSKQKKNGGRKSKHNRKNGKKKQKNQTKRNGRNDAEKDSRQSLNVNCVQKLNKYAKTGPTALRTMYRKGIRAERFNDDILKKLAKCGSFYGPSNYLRRILRCNSFPLCRGGPANPNDEFGHLQVLENCEAELKKACKPVLTPFSDILNIYTCRKVFDTFRDDVFKKLNGINDPAEDICNTVNALPASIDIEYGKITNCKKVMDIFEADAKTQKTSCLKVFTACRKAEREVARLDAKCRNRIDSPAIVKLNEIIIPIKELNLNVECIISQITSFPWPPGTGRQLLNKRQKRQIEETDDLACLEILDAWKTFNVSAVAATDSVSGPTDLNAADQAISALQSILNRKNFTDDIISCANATDNSVYEEISDYMTWAFIWTVEVVEPKIEMLTALQDNETTCSTPTTISTVESTNPTSTSTSTTSVANSTANSTPNVANSTAASSSAPNVANSTAASSSAPNVANSTAASSSTPNVANSTATSS